MRFHVTHVIRFRYSGGVFLEPHTFRLRPRADSWQNLLHFDLRMVPEPAGRTEVIDAEGNCVTHAWFEDTTDRLEAQMTFEVETLRRNPFDYILLDPAAGRLPLQYATGLREQLAAFSGARTGPDSAVAELARSIAQEAQNETLGFLTILTQRLYQTCEIETREQGDPLDAEETLALRKGACRDLTVLFMECCRVMGLAARFVSGYQQGDPDADERDMHAWPEVYIPGGGWRGYDPTHGLVVADAHVAVAAAAHASLAAPVSGTFRGSGVTCNIEFEVQMEVSENGESGSV